MTATTPFLPISELTAADGHVLVVAASGCIETPLRATVGFRAASGEVLSLDGRPLGQVGLPIIGYMPLPWSEAEAEALIIAHGTSQDDDGDDPSIDGISLAYQSRGIVFEMAEAIGPKRAMEHLAALFGLTEEQGLTFPNDTPPEIFIVKKIASEWMDETITPENAIAAAARVLDGSAPAEEEDTDETGSAR